MTFDFSPIPAAVLAVALLAVPRAVSAQDMASVRRDFMEKTAAPMAQILDMAAVEEVSTRLPGGRTLRQTVKIFVKGEKKRYEMEAPTNENGIIRFLTITTADEAWTITPRGDKIKMDPSTHGAARPDPVLTYMAISLHPQARIEEKIDLEGKPAIVIINGPGGDRLWLDPENMTLVKIETAGPMGGKVEWIFQDFRMTGGLVLLPREVKMVAEGSVFYHHVGLLAVNAGLDDGLFDPDMAAGTNNRK